MSRQRLINRLQSIVIHGLFKVIVDLLAFFIDHGFPLVNHIEHLALLPPYSDLQALLVSPYIVNLLF